MNLNTTSNKLPDGWTLAQIDDLIGANGIFIDGDWIESKDQNSRGSVRLIQLADIGDGNFRNRSNRFMTNERAVELNCTFLEHGDILVARMPEPLGRAVIFPYFEKNKYVTVVDIAIIRTVGGVYNKYLMNCINSPRIRKEINALETGTTRKRISRNNLSKIVIPIPPIEEQYRIVEKIEELVSEIDNSIVSLKTAENQLKVYRQILLNDAFAGKQTHFWRENNQAKPAMELLLEIEAERHKSEEKEIKDWEESVKIWEGNGRIGKKPFSPRKRKTIDISDEEIKKLPLLPKGWQYTRIANVSSVSTGITPLKSRTDYYQHGTIPWITSGALNDWYVKEPSAYITETALRENKLKIYPKHTLLIALYGEGKTRGKCSELLIESTTNQAIAAISQSGLEQRLRKYLKWFLLKNYFELRELASGGAQQNLNISIIEKTIFPVPNVEEINIIIEELELNFSIIDNLEMVISENLKKSEILRQTILDQAINGKLVPQDSKNEPARDFIERIKSERDEYLLNNKEFKKKITKGIMKSDDQSILDVLRSSKEPMSAEEVWKQSKHKDNIEEFYAELKKVQSDIIEVKKGILSLSK